MATSWYSEIFLKFGPERYNFVREHKYLGLHFGNLQLPGYGFSTDPQESYELKELHKRLGWLKYVKSHAFHKVARQLFLAMVRSKMMYGILIKPDIYF